MRKFAPPLLMIMILSGCAAESPVPTIGPKATPSIATAPTTLSAAAPTPPTQAAIGTAPLLVTVTPLAAPDPNALNPTEQQIYDLLNQQRRDAGLKPTMLDPRLTAIARARSADMAARNYFDHTSPDGTNFVDILKQQGIGYSRTGEIIATDTYPADQTATITVDGWMHSQGHHDIILTPEYTLVGVGQALKGDTHYYTAIYLTP